MSNKTFGPKYQSDHPQVKVNLEFEVDELLAPLIEKLWSLGLMTQYSCQDNMGSAYILFPMERDARYFGKQLHDNELMYYYSPRELTWGGGASVHFSNKQLDAIMIAMDKAPSKRELMPLFWKDLMEINLVNREECWTKYGVKCY